MNVFNLSNGNRRGAIFLTKIDLQRDDNSIDNKI